MSWSGSRARSSQRYERNSASAHELEGGRKLVAMKHRVVGLVVLPARAAREGRHPRAGAGLDRRGRPAPRCRSGATPHPRTSTHRSGKRRTDSTGWGPVPRKCPQKGSDVVPSGTQCAKRDGRSNEQTVRIVKNPDTSRQVPCNQGSRPDGSPQGPRSAPRAQGAKLRELPRERPVPVA